MHLHVLPQLNQCKLYLCVAKLLHIYYNPSIFMFMIHLLYETVYTDIAILRYKYLEIGI